MRILCVGKKTLNIRGKKQAYYAWANPKVGMPTFFPTHFMRGKKMRIIYVGKKNAYYAWAKTLWECPLFLPRILCVGKRAHNIRGKKPRILCMGKTHGGNAHA